MPHEPGSGGENEASEGLDLSSANARRMYCRAIVEALEGLREKGLFQRLLQLCGEKGVSRGTIKRWIETENSAPRVDKLKAVAGAVKSVGADLSKKDAKAIDVNSIYDRLKDAEKPREQAKAIQEQVDRALSDDVLTRHKSDDLAVLFCDLVGSTEFKRNHKEIDWLKKTRLHNQVAAGCVEQQNGEVNKYLGDGLMALFKGTDYASRALKAGLAIISSIELENTHREYEAEDVLETSVGVACGRVFYFTFEQSTEPDPQGSTVDLAARLCSLAGSQQLICSGKCFDDAGGESAFPNSCKEEGKRFVKGFDEAVPMRLVSPEERECGDIQLVGHRRDTAQKNVELLENARLRLQRGEYPDAMKAFVKLVDKEPGNFEANFRLAELLLMSAGETKGDRSERIANAIKHLRTARQINPSSCRVWLMASWAQARSFEESGKFGDLDRAVAHAETALDRAKELMDIDGMNSAKASLARLLLLRSTNPTNDGAGDLSRAGGLCNELQETFNGVQKIRKVQYLVTRTLVEIAQGKTSLDEIDEKYLTEAEKLDPNNKDVLLAKAKLVEARERKNPPTTPIF